MTTDDRKQDLIEKMLLESGLGAVRGGRPTPSSVERMRVALAVFEAAQRPSDDERKAIAQVVLPVFDQLASSVYRDVPYSEAESALEAADLLLAAGFRHPVPPEPQGVVPEEPEGEQVLIERYGVHHATFGGIGGDVSRLTITREAWKAMGAPDVLTVYVVPAEQTTNRENRSEGDER